tara:strand:+ start:215 stop:466 length:252 start_codon:yes stop_codon:yes gene_type:complete
MSILTRIDGIPVFTERSRAISWGQQYNLNGVHTHTFQGQTGYMAGASHSVAVAAVTGGVINPITTIPNPTIGGGGGGGGGGGY